jgi:hypothetical protein
MSLQVLLTNSMRLIYILMTIHFDLTRVPRKLMFMFSRWIYILYNSHWFWCLSTADVSFFHIIVKNEHKYFVQFIFRKSTQRTAFLTIANLLCITSTAYLISSVIFVDICLENITLYFSFQDRETNYVLK